MKLTEALQTAGVSAIIYGESGIGKTHFAGTLPGKTLILAAEANGIKTLARSENAGNIEIVYLPEPGTTIEETNFRYDLFFMGLSLGKVWSGDGVDLNNKNCIPLDHDNIVLDSATELANQLLIQKTDPSKNGGIPTMKNYGEVQFAMKRYLRILRDLAQCKGKNIIIIALEAELVLSQNADAQTSKTHPALSGKKLSPEAEGLFDIVAHLEKRSDGIRVFRLEGNDNFVAKDRFGRKGCAATGAALLTPPATTTDKKEK